MTPKEKAHELFNKMDMIVYTDQDNWKSQCIRCAIVGVDEILNNNCGSRTDEANATNSEIYCDEYFWNDVKSELQSL